MKCRIYKSLKKSEAYLYLAENKQLEELPNRLEKLLGKLEFVMDLELTPDRKLARVNVLVVIENLQKEGFYLQMPPLVPV